MRLENRVSANDQMSQPQLSRLTLTNPPRDALMAVFDVAVIGWACWVSLQKKPSPAK